MKFAITSFELVLTKFTGYVMCIIIVVWFYHHVIRILYHVVGFCNYVMWLKSYVVRFFRFVVLL